MASRWAVHKATNIPLHDSIEYCTDIPWTISYVIRKLVQVDNLNELPKEKRPPESILWWGKAKDLDNWLDKVLGNASKKSTTQASEFVFEIEDSEVG